MGKTFAIAALCLGLGFAQAARAEVAADAAGSPEALFPNDDTARFSLADRSLRMDPAAALSRDAWVPALHVLAPPAGVRATDGTVQYIEGPKWTYRPSSQGPVLEVAALGAGMESAPFLAHVGLDWHF